MSPAALKYLDVIGELRIARFERELVGETLPQAIEVEFVAELDRLWHQVADDEQDEIERVLAGHGVAGAAAALLLVDAPTEGDHAPRQRAA